VIAARYRVLSRPYVFALWSVAASRLVLAGFSVLLCSSLVDAFEIVHRSPVPSITDPQALASEGSVTWRSRVAAVALIVIWLVLELAVRFDPNWRRLRRRRRQTKRRNPVLASYPIAAISGAAAGGTSIVAGVLLAGTAVVAIRGANPLADEMVAFGLLVVGTVIVAGLDVSGQVMIAALFAGLAVGGASLAVVPSQQDVLSTMIAWPLLLLAVAGVTLGIKLLIARFRARDDGYAASAELTG
jgi:hypothetical protein